MEPVTLTAVATAIATIVLTKALEKTGEKLGEAALEESRKLIAQLHQKNKLPLLANTTQENPQSTLDYGQAVLELKQAADGDTEIAQAVREVEAAANADPQVAPKVQALANNLNSQPATVINSTKLAETIKNVFQGNTFTGTINF
jgi:predicted RND superfamily exporter protein